ncbi:DUF362 domain-containing protein [Candidatus Bathyarchaeota archaeon]|nr:DUF362 domain-containing protein [Candidatus Bathyarchaeota archaeon]
MGGQFFPKIKIPRILNEADLFISVPKLKIHPLTGLSCALKNQFGCIPFKRKIIFHKNIHEIIAFINKSITPDLVLVDGIICKGRTPIRLNLLMASHDPVAIDFIAAKIAGLNPLKIEYIVKSEGLGVGSTNVKCTGDEWKNFATIFTKKSFIYNLSLKLLISLYNLYLRLFTVEGKKL